MVNISNLYLIKAFAFYSVLHTIVEIVIRTSRLIPWFLESFMIKIKVKNIWYLEFRLMNWVYFWFSSLALLLFFFFHSCLLGHLSLFYIQFSRRHFNHFFNFSIFPILSHIYRKGCFKLIIRVIRIAVVSIYILSIKIAVKCCCAIRGGPIYLIYSVGITVGLNISWYFI